MNVLGAESCSTKNSRDQGAGEGATKMEEKYDPLQLVSHVWGKFWAFPEHQDSQIEDYSIFIEIRYSKKEYYQIRATKNGTLWKGTDSGTTWRHVKDEEELYKKRDFLGAVHVRFRDKPIKINGKILDPFPNYIFFWNYISSAS
jgi:hypothetical protein